VRNIQFPEHPFPRGIFFELFLDAGRAIMNPLNRRIAMAKKFSLKKIDRKKAKKIALAAGAALLALALAVCAVKFFRARSRDAAAKREAYRFGFKASFEVSMLRSCIEASRGQADYCNCYTERFVAMMEGQDWDRFMDVSSPQETLELIENDPSISAKIRMSMAECVGRVKTPKSARVAGRAAGQAAKAPSAKKTAVPAVGK
jgi:hypothetical protein